MQAFKAVSAGCASGPASTGADGADSTVTAAAIAAATMTPVVVFGMQGLFDWGNFEGSGPLSSLPVNTEHTRVSWLWSMTGRVGFLVQPAALVYVKGGGAWVYEHHFETMSNNPNYLAEALVNRIGWTAGGGFEYMVTTNWSAFLEYDYMGFGGHFTNFNCPACTLNFEIRQNMQQALFGLNYRFGN